MGFKQRAFLCGICAQINYTKFYVKGCVHFYCHRCISSYVASKLDYNVTKITCPVQQCTGSLNHDYCRNILPKHVLDRWIHALHEKAITESETVDYLYCPFKDCSALLTYKKGIIKPMLKSKCPSCKRGFCATCRVPWHAEFDCENFQRIMRQRGDCEGNMVKELAKKKNWRRCPRCKIYIEKSFGCYRMVCRCGCEFCYLCGDYYFTHTTGRCLNPTPSRESFEFQVLLAVGFLLTTLVMFCIFILC